MDSIRRRAIRFAGTKGYEILYEENRPVEFSVGPEADHFEDWRRGVVPNLHTVFEWFDGYAQYPLDRDEYAGTIESPPEQTEEVLWENDLVRNPLAALKTDPMDTVEVGSWMYRDEPTAERQIHVMLFEYEEEGQIVTDLYAHEEYSAGHPDPEIAVKHYGAEEYDPEEGVRWVRQNLPIDHTERFD